MANQEYKTTVITYDSREPQVEPVIEKAEETKPNIHNVLFNVTTKVPHVTETLPTVKVETTEQTTKKIDLRGIEKINKNASAFPKFYIKEYKRSMRLVFMWLFFTAICLGLELWAMIAIIQNPNVSNWTMLTLIPAITLCVAFTIVYINNWLNFRNEAKNVDFNQGKIPTISVMKLYKRLKSAHINVNWFCCLTYVAGGLAILITYLIGLGLSIKQGNPQWGVLDPNFYAQTCGPALLITVIICSAAMITAFLLHVILLVTNYVRAGKIDSFYSVQIVSDEELTAIKKRKNKRDLIIFLAVVMVIALIALLIYKIVKSKKVNNTVTINNGPTVGAPI